MNRIESSHETRPGVASIIEEGKHFTDDMKPDSNDPTADVTREMAEAICQRMAELSGPAE